MMKSSTNRSYRKGISGVAALSMILLMIFPCCITSKSNQAGEISTGDSFDDGTAISPPLKSEYTSSRNLYNVSYDMEYTRVKYSKVLSITPPSIILQYTDYTGYGAFSSGGNSFRAIGVNDGKIYIINSTDPSVIRYNLTYWNYVTVDSSSSLDCLLVLPGSLVSAGVFSNYTIVIRAMTINTTAALPSIVYTKNITIPMPGSITPASTVIRGVGYFAGYYAVWGKYVNGSQNVPFLYYASTDGTDIQDVLEIDSGTNEFYRGMDDIILHVYAEYAYAVIVSNDRIVYMTYPATGSRSIFFNETLPNSLNEITNEIDFSSTQKTDTHEPVQYRTWFSFSVCSLTTFESSIYIVKHGGAGSYDTINIEYRESSSWRTESFSKDNVFIAQTAQADSIFVNGIDKNFINWNNFIVSTGEYEITLPLQLRTFIPIDISRVDATNDSYFEVPFADARNVWVAQFSNDLDAIHEVGSTTEITSASFNSISVRHSRGTGYFDITMGGFIERNNTSDEVVEIGAVPVLLRNQATKMAFSMTDDYYFVDAEILVKAKTYFRSFGRDFIEFFIDFESEYTPVTYNPIEGIELADALLTLVVYERYNNGTLNQRYLNLNLEEVKSVILDIDYELETQIQIEDSHLLNELHIFSGGIEYDPYSMFFLNWTSGVLITDKITNDTLFNEDFVTFSDPLIVPIPSKYEFVIRLYSTFDYFGIDPVWVNMYVNGTELSSEIARILSPNAHIIVTDFANETVNEFNVNKYRDGTNVKLALDLAQVIINNGYNRTVKFFLTKGDTEIYYPIPQQTGFFMRLALGQYNYRVEELDGTIISDVNITISNSETISFGFTEVFIQNWDDLPFTFVDTIISIAAAAIIMVVLFIAWNYRTFNKVKPILKKMRMRKP